MRNHVVSEVEVASLWGGSWAVKRSDTDTDVLLVDGITLS